MKVVVRPPQDVELVLTMTRDELQGLADAATQKGRRTRAQQRLLDSFGRMLLGEAVRSGRAQGVESDGEKAS